MALLNRLFPSKKKNHKQGYVSFGRNDSVSWKPFNFSKEQVQVLLFRECDARGRKLLFDSNAVRKTPLENQQCTKLKFGSRPKCDSSKKNETYVEITNGFGYQYTRPSSDVTLMGEMIFGSVAMTFRGTALKVHSMHSPDRLMCTKVFHAPVPTQHSKRISDNSLEDSYGSSMNSVGDYIPGQGTNSDTKLGSSCGSGPLDVPFSMMRGKAPTSSLEGDSGFCGDASLHSVSSMGSSGLWGPYTTSPDSRNGSGSMLGGGSCHSGGSLASLQRRWLRNMSTSLELGVRGSSSSVNADDVLRHSQRKTQLGLTIVINLTPEEEKDMQLFFFEHMAVIEGMVERLRWSVERAYVRKEIFVHLMMEGYQDLQQWMCDLFSAPRLPNPMWICLVSAANHVHHQSNQRSLATTFLRDLCQLIASIDTKATNFFVSTLVTAVLTHHLGWVATVLPAKGPPYNVSKPPCTIQMLSALAKSHPYNALWAQLGDLYGALGNPVRVARTIVTSSGKKTDLLNRLLSSLSYFIRCGDIEKRIDNRAPTKEEMEELNTILEGPSSQNMKSSMASTSTILAGNSSESPLKCFNVCFERSSSQVTSKPARNGSGCSSPSVNAREMKLPQDAVGIGYNFSSQSEWERDDLQQHTTSSIARRIDSRCASTKEHDVDVGSNHSTTTLCENQVPFYRSEKSMYSKTCSNLQNLDSTSFNDDIPKQICIPCENPEPVPRMSAGMKRSTSFMTKPSTTTPEVERTKSNSQETTRLYPSIADLMVEENRQREESFLCPEVISEKVNRLCRVPTSAVVYHLKDNQTMVNSVEEFHHKKMENERQLSSMDVSRRGGLYVPSPLEAGEKHRRSPDVSEVKFNFDECSSTENMNHPEGTSKKADSVVFVLGEDEELVGLRSHSRTSLNKSRSNTSLCSTDSQSRTCVTSKEMNNNSYYPSLDELMCCEDLTHKPNCSSNSNKLIISHSVTSSNRLEQTGPVTDICERLNSSISVQNEELCDPGFVSNEESGLDSGIVLDEQLQESLTSFVCVKCEHLGRKSCEWDDERTSKDEVSPSKNSKVVTAHSSVIELEDECGGVEVKITDTLSKNLKPVVRSQSLSFPLRKSASKKKTNICRRHSEYIHENERYLKDYHSVRFNFERCEGVLGDYVEGTGVEKSPQADKKSLKINEARGNFEQQDNCGGKPYLCESCHIREMDVKSEAVLSSGELCSNCDSCLEEEVTGPCSIMQETGVLQTDESREGNALFDEYGTLSDEEALASSHCSSKDNIDVTLESKSGKAAEEDRAVIMLPLPRCVSIQPGQYGPGLAATLLGGVVDHYVADLVLHGCTQAVQGWEKNLRRDLVLAAHHPLLDQEISEAVCVVGNVDLWEVQLVSSHISGLDNPGTFGIRVGMSQLVANMLESLVHLWRLRTPPDQCLLHLESKLRELCLRSQALAELLLTTEFCDMASLTAALGLEANDVPLLLAVASTHTPQVTRHYGLSFR